MNEKYDPYRRPFPRWYQLEHYPKSLVHPFERMAMEPYLKRKNPEGFHHDLGAIDAIFDNFGVLIQEQFTDCEIYRQYINELPKLALLWWQAAKRQIIRKRPFWGNNYNAASRDANAGEPRSLLRLLADEDISSYSSILDCLDNRCQFAAGYRCLNGSLFDNGRFINPFWDHESATFADDRLFEFDDWDAETLFPQDGLPILPHIYQDGAHEPNPYAGGIVLPEGYSDKVDSIRILHPRHCTPDLPLRVGSGKKDFDLYARVWRDQGQLGTCASCAVSVALDILARRIARSDRNLRFSPAWLHCMSGDSGATGRSVNNVFNAIRHRLPCLEKEYPYDAQRLKEWRKAGPPWETPKMTSSSKELTEQFGVPIIRELDVTDISNIKAHLAGGWLVIVSTCLTEVFWEHGILKNPFGLTFTPLKGHKRKPEGHAWLLTGYEHVDGNQRWKYQGRFIALNAWNVNRTRGKGIVTLPFAMFLTEGIEAFAIRLRP